jgi:hypothetical protein
MAEANELSLAQLEEAKRWAELEEEFLNRWMNRRLIKQWQTHLDTLQQEETDEPRL